MRKAALLLLALSMLASANEALAERRDQKDAAVEVTFVPELSPVSKSPSKTPMVPRFSDDPDYAVTSVLPVSENPAAQAALDVVAEKALATPSGRNTFCRMFASASDVANDFGTTASASAKIFAGCESLGLTLPAHFAGSRSEKVSRRFLLVQTNMPSPIESWTSIEGDVFVFHTGHLTEFSFARALIHEYFIAYDDKAFFKQSSLSNYTDDPKWPLTPNQISQLGFSTFAEAFEAPIVAGTFQLARALYFENVLLREMFSLPGGAVDSNCWRHIQTLANLVAPIQHMYRTARIFDQSSTSLLSFKTINAATFMKLEEIAKRFDSKDQLCRYLSKPTVGLTLHTYSAGPRPRIGSGTQLTGKAKPSENKSIEALALQAEKSLKVKLPLSFAEPLTTSQIDLPMIKNPQLMQPRVNSPLRFEK
ncbi:MAG: hypothetical protein EOP06_13845 [Proteobacteria bacterium]|nr:MAG: hypothetical protein EOP06_13845 [Pseudomonadota bacterium]